MKGLTRENIRRLSRKSDDLVDLLFPYLVSPFLKKIICVTRTNSFFLRIVLHFLTTENLLQLVNTKNNDHG